jgi:hypothetical protein
MAANLPSRSVRQAYDYVVSEGSPENYEEFIRLYPHDPLCDDIRVLLYNLKVAKAWHKAVLANSPVAYKTFHENYSNSLYAPAALKLYGAPKAVPLMQFTHLAKQSPMYKPGNFGHRPGHFGAHANMSPSSKIVTMPAKGMTPIKPGNFGNNGKMTKFPGKLNANPGNNGKVTGYPGKFNSRPMRVNRPMDTTAPRHFGGRMGGGGFSQRFAASPSRSSFGGGGSLGGGRSFGGGGFGRR